MALFQPISGIRYDPDRVNLVDVVAPPYDIIDNDSRALLEARSPYNSVYVELGRDGAERDRYEQATCHFDQWLADGVLRVDEEPSFYVYSMGWRDEAGQAHQTTGIMGGLELSTPEEGRVLPHEQTLGKPKGDRLRLLQACRANVSPVWALSLAEGLSELCQVTGPPVARATDDDGVHHRLWRITQPGVMAAITEALASAPVMLADGHHRYETALAYRDERRAATGEADGDYNLILAFVVELTEDQLKVQPIHRLIAGLPNDFDLVGALARSFDVTEVTDPSEGAPSDADVDGTRTWTWTWTVPTPGASPNGWRPRAPWPFSSGNGPGCCTPGRPTVPTIPTPSCSTPPWPACPSTSSITTTRPRRWPSWPAPARPRRQCWYGRWRCARSRPPPGPATACRPRPPSSPPSPAPAWSSAASTTDKAGAAPAGLTLAPVRPCARPGPGAGPPSRQPSGGNPLDRHSHAASSRAWAATSADRARFA